MRLLCKLGRHTIARGNSVIDLADGMREFGVCKHCGALMRREIGLGWRAEEDRNAA